MVFKQYDPSQVSFSFMGNNITGFMDGTFIEVERDEDGFTKHVGSLGDVTRTRNLNHAGKITLTLMAQSPSNDILNTIYAQDEQFGTNYGALQIIDHNGNMKVHVTYAWIMKAPKIERAKESGTTVWVFDCADVEIVAGGGVV